MDVSRDVVPPLLSLNEKYAEARAFGSFVMLHMWTSPLRMKPERNGDKRREERIPGVLLEFYSQGERSSL